MNEHTDPELDWASLRTAYHVARLGTLSAAARHLGLHHATAIRHIDALEAQLRCKLFQRHPRGYMPTEAGETLFQVVGRSDEQFVSIANRLKDQSETVSGDLTVTALGAFSPWLTPLITEFQRFYPDIRLSLDLVDRLVRLELGEAHIALRAGPKPTEPDNIVRRVGTIKFALYAHESYVESYGKLRGSRSFGKHRFVGASGAKLHVPMHQWLETNVPAPNIVFRASEPRSHDDAIRAGAGIGFLPINSDRENKKLVMMKSSLAELDSALWLVTHRDLNRVAKVNALTQFLVERMQATFS